jgi:hypothetical protein
MADDDEQLLWDCAAPSVPPTQVKFPSSEKGKKNGDSSNLYYFRSICMVIVLLTLYPNQKSIGCVVKLSCKFSGLTQVKMTR